MQSAAHEPLFDIDPRTGISIEVFFADRTMETFGRCGAGWFWWCAPARLLARQAGRLGRLLQRYAAYRQRDDHDRVSS